MMVAPLAILKAGGAYVPLAPAAQPSGSTSCWRTPAWRRGSPRDAGRRPATGRGPVVWVEAEHARHVPAGAAGGGGGAR